MLDNAVYSIYGVWDSADSYMKHLESEHMRKLFDFNKKNDIIWFMYPLHKIGRQPE